MMHFKIVFLLLLALSCNQSQAQVKKKFTRADTLRGTITSFRQWDVLHYDLVLWPDLHRQTITGINTITFKGSEATNIMQIDLQQPMQIDSIIDDRNHKLSFKREGNAWLINRKNFSSNNHNDKSTESKIRVYFSGKPVQAANAPWDGGLVWSKDEWGNPWVATACQGLGASVWWPCKDHQSDEPERGATITIFAPDNLMAVSNGKLIDTIKTINGIKGWKWNVINPINTYSITMNIGNYISWTDTLNGERGELDLEYWVLQNNLQKAKQHFTQTKPVLRCMEYWLGKYPFYEDGFKLVETPFLGMEHQSAIAYGNKYQNGYFGSDIRSNSGWGMLWDYIIVHETGHEWFGNSITTNDIADMWVHESFTTYTEVLYTECHSGRQAASEYADGLRRIMYNDRPIIGKYGVNHEGSGDMYNKGALIIHTIRNMMNNDEKFRQMLRKMNETFFQRNINTAQVEHFIQQYSGLSMPHFFDQYLRTNYIPVFEFYKNPITHTITYRLSRCVTGLQLPLWYVGQNKTIPLPASSEWKTVTLPTDVWNAWDAKQIEKLYLVKAKQVTRAPANLR